ncbi:uncharacterized protein HKW66_Vig0113290 [Vigna angularis]|uniref:Uncharacterized protein n=1 Tax=Phaseolus angularis TaxID=3914 RepID=A0A8T0KWR5_PHAAN|nr:uncharacterized protein HKW66_Vig0113290 [Vigna angularis]
MPFDLELATYRGDHEEQIVTKWMHVFRVSLVLPHSLSSLQTLASTISSPSSKPRTLVCSFRACNASLEPFSDEEFAKQIEDLALKFQLSYDAVNANDTKSKDFQEIFTQRGTMLRSSSWPDHR